jgi:hypothetical protein
VTLEEVIKKFKKKYYWLQDPYEADNKCAYISELFFEFVLKSGVRTRAKPRIIYYDAGTIRYHPIRPKIYTTKEWETASQVEGPGRCTGHAVFGLGRWRVDWTARQFDPTSPFPVVWKTAS